jgi:hypothetical protein
MGKTAGKADKVELDNLERQASLATMLRIICLTALMAEAWVGVASKDSEANRGHQAETGAMAAL